jgi:hypothetical protein
MSQSIPYLDPEVKPPDYRVPRGRSGTGARSALETLLKDIDRVQRAKEAYGDLPKRPDPSFRV